MTGSENDSGKPRWYLLPLGPTRDVSAVITVGADEYGDEYVDDNWKRV